MSAPLSRKTSFVLTVAAVAALTACSSATRPAATPQKPGTAALTGAKITPRVQRVLVAERGVVAMVARDGCVATVTSAELEAGSSDELRVRCPRPERLATWFAGVDKLTASVPLEEENDDEDEDVPLPVAELVTSKGRVLRVTNKTDAERLAGEVRAFTAELAASEMPSPGPASPAGWQMLRVSGPAHVFFAGTPTKGVLDARVSTSGQYFCEFLANTEDGPMRATKSGWIAPKTASHAIDEVLVAFEGLAEGERPQATFASGVTANGERKASASSTAAVFERFAPVQDALGDACVPELEAPVASPSTL